MLVLLKKLLLAMVGGSRNERIVRTRMRFITEHVNPLEDQMLALSDAQMLEKHSELRSRIVNGESRESIRPEAYALIREASRRARNHRQYDVQLVAGMILDDSWIAEEATGEGKTIACYPPAYMAILEGMHVHVVTTNDYLVKRDAEFAQPIFAMLGLTVGYITADMPAYGQEANIRRQAYACNITYGMNSEFGFDYLRDNMKLSTAEQVQSDLGFAIVDEVDNILIDEARTPLIISGPAYGDSQRYAKANTIALDLINRNRTWDRVNGQVESLKRETKTLGGELGKLKGDERQELQSKLEEVEAKLIAAEDELIGQVNHYEVEIDRKSAHMTHDGVGVAQEIAGVGSFYVGSNMDWPHLMEQALRGHLVYERDKDYVVQDGEVIIVDEFTGRLMHGRQWSDGLHQAVEAKENVRIKEETQTIATITLQNYFRLYKKLAGMTGTAMTEAEEFLKIYKLDAASVPTHRPVNRVDYNDRIYAEIDPKYDAIVDDIYEVSMTGRPVLVGTTSIEKSERISQMLTRRYGTEHRVLNGRIRDADVEGEIVKIAGQQHPLKKGSDQMIGNVTIATNMAGRGTDIKLAEATVWKHCRVPNEDKLTELAVAAESLYPFGCNKCCIHCDQYDSDTNCAHCFKPKLDSEFPLRGRTACREEVPCGLHIVATERHESRRIDNQLRGRSGRQGDPGSSRFFLSLRDDLMAIFAGEWTLKVLGWLGLSGDQAIEDKRISKGIERAQKKVELRNFEIRKNLLEYDEVMDYQRHTFYGQRQTILEGRELEGLIMEMLGESVDDAIDNYLDGQYAARCIAEWAKQNLQVPVEASQIRATHPGDLPALEDDLRRRAREEAASVISITLGEYMDEDIDQQDWDLKGLSSWAMSRFSVSLSQNQIRKLTVHEVEIELCESAGRQIDTLDLTPMAKFLAEDFPARSLADWAEAKFGIAIDPGKITTDAQEMAEKLMVRVTEAYSRREIEYPIEYIIDVTVGRAGTENVYALGGLSDWANRKYDCSFTPEQFQGAEIEDIHRQLLELSEQWFTGGKLEEEVRSQLSRSASVDDAVEYALTRFDTELSPEAFNGDVEGVLIATGREFLRREMTQLERFVLLQIYDVAWKDHLLAMDHLRGGIGLRSYAEQDPRVAFKREGSRMFVEMLAGISEKVTDMIFKVRLSAEAQLSSVYQVSNQVHEQMSAYDQVARDVAARQQAEQMAGEAQKVKTITRDVSKVGRNDPCPCGSGKKFKKCCGVQ